MMVVGRSTLLVGVAVLLASGAYLAACSSNAQNAWEGDAGSAAEASAVGAACKPCLSNADCGGALCAQFAGDTYCAAACSTGVSCPSDQACTSLNTTNGQSVNACVPRGGVCGGAS